MKRQALWRLHRRYGSHTLAASLLLGCAWPLHASETTLTLQATVIEVQCNVQQRMRIRACAPAIEKFTVEAAKTVRPTAHVAVNDRLAWNDAGGREPSRQVLIRTLLY
jgi:hypothetical protein